MDFFSFLCFTSGDTDIFINGFVVWIGHHVSIVLRFLVPRESQLSSCFWLFDPKFWELVESYEWYFAFYECRFSSGDTNEVVGTLKPCLMQRNLFDLFAITGGRTTSNLGTSTCTINHAKLSLFLIWLVLQCRKGKEPLSHQWSSLDTFKCITYRLLWVTNRFAHQHPTRTELQILLQLYSYWISR